LSESQGISAEKSTSTTKGVSSTRPQLPCRLVTLERTAAGRDAHASRGEIELGARFFKGEIVDVAAGDTWTGKTRRPARAKVRKAHRDERRASVKGKPVEQAPRVGERKARRDERCASVKGKPVEMAEAIGERKAHRDERRDRRKKSPSR
jgi:hypothetical protein